MYYFSQEVRYTEVRPTAIPTFFDTSFYIGSKFIRVDNNSIFYKLPNEDGSKRDKYLQAFVEKMTDTITGITRERFFGIDTILLEEFSFHNYKDQHLNVGKHVKIDSNGTIFLVVDYDNDTVYTPQNIVFSQRFNKSKLKADSIVLNNFGEAVFKDCKLDLKYSLCNSWVINCFSFEPYFERSLGYYVFYYDLLLKDGYRLKLTHINIDSNYYINGSNNKQNLIKTNLSLDEIIFILKENGIKATYRDFDNSKYKLVFENDYIFLEYENDKEVIQVDLSVYKVKIQKSRINLYTGEFSIISVVDSNRIIIRD
jgi:hypothetical protein